MSFLYSTDVLATFQEMERTEEHEYESLQWIKKHARTIQVTHLKQYIIDMKTNAAKQLANEFQVILFVPFLFYERMSWHFLKYTIS